MILGDTILETRGLTKEFRGFTAVNGVNLRVRRGAIHALIGPNGAGKTTCFNLLTKFLTPTAGQIVFNGIDITDDPLAATLEEQADHSVKAGFLETADLAGIYDLTLLNQVLKAEGEPPVDDAGLGVQ